MGTARADRRRRTLSRIIARRVLERHLIPTQRERGLRGGVVFSSRRRHTRSYGDWSSDVCSSDLAATKVYSTAAYWIAGAVAIALALCPTVGAAISAIPPGVLGGATIVLYGLVGILGVRIWMTNHVDFTDPVNQMTAAIPLILGIADFTWRIGDLTFTGIALGSIAALVIYHGMRGLRRLRGVRDQNGGGSSSSESEVA